MLADSVTVDWMGAPCKFAGDGETAQVELGGAPLQLRVIVPVKPSIGATLMV